MKGDQLDTPQIGLDDDRPPKTYLENEELWWHGIAFLLAMGIAVLLLAYLVMNLSCGTAAPACPSCSSEEWRLVALVVIAGWMGGLIHAATSFATFAGNRQLMHSWLWWFYLRPPIGVLLAILVYLAARAGIIGDGEIKECADIYQYALLAGIAGLFSKQTTDKLSDLVDTLFSPSKPPVRYDALDHRESANKSGVAPTFEEMIQRVQRTLIDLGYLPRTMPKGQASDNGILGDETRAAIEAFLKTEKITGEDRQATLGDETDPDYWVKLLQLLEEAKSKFSPGNPTSP